MPLRLLNLSVYFCFGQPAYYIGATLNRALHLNYFFRYALGRT